jgi:hypothetical protein
MLLALTRMVRTRVRATQDISAMAQLALYVMALTNIKMMLDSHHVRLVLMEHLVLLQLEWSKQDHIHNVMMILVHILLPCRPMPTSTPLIVQPTESCSKMFVDFCVMMVTLLRNPLHTYAKHLILFLQPTWVVIFSVQPRRVDH